MQDWLTHFLGLYGALLLCVGSLQNKNVLSTLLLTSTFQILINILRRVLVLIFPAVFVNYSAVCKNKFIAKIQEYGI